MSEAELFSPIAYPLSEPLLLRHHAHTKTVWQLEKHPRTMHTWLNISRH